MNRFRYLSRKGMTAAAAMLLLSVISSCHGRHAGDTQPSGDTVEVDVEEVSDSARQYIEAAAAQAVRQTDSAGVQAPVKADSSAVSAEEISSLMERLNRP